MIYIKNATEITKIKAAVALWKKAIALVDQLIVTNQTGKKIDQAVAKLVKAAGGTCTFKGYNGFPGNLCVSVNEVAIHGIPNHRPFLETDKIGVDIGVTLDGAICDAGYTKLINPDLNPDYQDLINHTYNALWAGLKVALSGNYVGDIAHAIETYVRTNCPQYKILQDFAGHGCGLFLHESPSVPNYGMRPKSGAKLVPGMVICIEPILTTAEHGAYYIDPTDKWSVCVNKGGQTCHWEHMVLILENESIVLTANDDEVSTIKKDN